MRTLLIGALAATLVGCNCLLPPQAAMESCTDANRFSCFDRAAASLPIEPEPASFKTNSATTEIKSTVAAETEKLSVFRFGDVEVDLTKRVVRKRGAEVHLTAIEYRLLSTMISNAERVITNRQILREVWGPSYVAHEHYVRVHMSHLRRKLEDDSAQPKHLLTETAVGYRLVP